MANAVAAHATAVDTWQAEGIRLSDVSGALGALRDQSRGHHTSARTAVMTLVAVAPEDEQAYDATDVLRVLAGHHPARIIILRPDPDQVATLGARATLYALDADHHRTNFEEIILTVGGQAAKHLDSLVESFTLSDLPVAVWYVRSIPDATDPLLSVATAILIDSRDAPDPGELRGLLRLARRRTMVDLSWNRLAPWRELMRGLFDSPSTRGLVDAITHIEVAGKTGPRRLLGGWLAAQTGVAPRKIALSDARHVSIHLTATGAGGAATFTVERPEGQRLVVAEAVVDGSTAIRATAALPEDALPASLAAALTRLQPDGIWERALSAATALED
ncbi:MAG: glucose-6-phosphate dehydrogenase assembly protein OpcA [Acidimicrobiales bacterium]|nr:glucose-6-phosphate dehydrogenase assembly protein OpcA [Acidimicrobiales bacterium]